MGSRVIWPTYSIGAWAANADDEHGCRWVVERGGASFVSDGVARKTRAGERPFGPGAHRSRSYPAARAGVLQGWCDAGDRASRVAARRRLMSVFPDGGQALLVVDDGIDPRQIAVELDAEAPRCAVWADGCGFDWQLPLYAADGRLLSVDESRARATLGAAAGDGLDWRAGDPGGLDWDVRVPGGPGGLDWGSGGGGQPVLAMENGGSATAWPVLECTTPSVWQDPAFTDPVTGGVLAYDGTLVAGQTLRIDCSPFSAAPVTLDGVDRSGALMSARFLSLPPGETRAVQVTGIGEGEVVATWRDADH